jgi:hypothetical protein
MSDALRNYVSENPSNLGNFMSADRWSSTHILASLHSANR